MREKCGRRIRDFATSILLVIWLTIPAMAENRLSDAEIIQRIDAAVRAREDAVAGYTVTEHYALYRNNGAQSVADLTVTEKFQRGTGKTYTTISQSGSAFLRGAVLERVINGEKEMSQAAIRDSVLVTSANYEMHPNPDTVQVNGRPCIVVDLKPRRKSPHLFNGKAWVDAKDFTVVRLEGTSAQNVSIFTGETAIARDYSIIDGQPMAVHAEARSHSFLMGDFVLKIDSTGYQIQLQPKRLM
jgi:outer membrane lipoprotein-sorting protein